MPSISIIATMKKKEVTEVVLESVAQVSHDTIGEDIKFTIPPTNDTPIVEALKAQILEYNEDIHHGAIKHRPLSYRLTKAYEVLGRKQPSSAYKPKSADALRADIMQAVNALVSNLQHKQLKALIKTESALVSRKIAGISLSEVVKSDKHTEEHYRALLNEMTEQQLWKLLELLIENKQPKPKEPKKARQATTYVSVDDKAAIDMVADYILTVRQGKPESPEYFRGGNCPNPTTAIHRLLFTYFCKEQCSTYNSVPEKVAKAYAKYPSASADDAYTEGCKKKIEEYVAEHPDFIEKVKAYATKPYIKAVLKKEEAANTEADNA